MFGLTPKTLYAAMNYKKKIELQEHLSKLLNRKIDIFSGDDRYYRERIFTQTSIKLHKDHIPINSKVCINTQKDYEYYIGILLYLHHQLELGVDPYWFITFHYQHPTEHIKTIRETANTFGFKDRIGYKPKSKTSLWKEVASYNYWEYKRNDEDQVIKDASQIRNLILKYLYGIKRLNQTWKHIYPNLLFFHEKGKTKLQYHTHLLIPKTKNLTSQEDLYDFFNTQVRKQRKCFSKWKSIDITPVENKYGVVGYLNKETTSKHISFDPYNSIPITTTTQK